MADRRLPFSVHDDAGEARQGEILILRSWQSDVKPNPAAAFTIVLSEQPLPEGETPQLSANVALCAPVRGVRLPAAVSEAAAVYGETAPAEPAPIRLSRSAHQAFADGTIFAPPAISITSREMFTGERRTPRLETLALQLIRSGGTDDGHWRAMDEALSLPREPSRTATPEIIRTRLRALLNRTAAGAGGAPAAAAIERLAQIADGAAPGAVTAASGTLADDIAFLRCLEEQPAAAAELSRMRLYLDGAHPASRNGELAGDRALARELISFVTVLAQPHRLEGIRASFEMFRAAYAVAYVAHHEAYVNDAASLGTDLEEASPGAAALPGAAVATVVVHSRRLPRFTGHDPVRIEAGAEGTDSGRRDLRDSLVPVRIQRRTAADATDECPGHHRRYPTGAGAGAWVPGAAAAAAEHRQVVGPGDHDDPVSRARHA
ncbi:MAG: hypothetical protein IIC89_05830 [Chloroflexi bacterium]|nr:hypothetical protein [Chloroflexota bacterium]